MGVRTCVCEHQRCMDESAYRCEHQRSMLSVFLSPSTQFSESGSLTKPGQQTPGTLLALPPELRLQLYVLLCPPLCHGLWGLK